MANTRGRDGEREPSAYSEQKIASILVAARELFTKNGYGATSMDSVAAMAGVGKATVYAHFKSKTDLFAAVIEGEARSDGTPVVAGTDESLGTTLGRFALDSFELILSPSNTAVFRVISAEASRFPELGKIFYESGPARLQATLAERLAAAMDRGELRRAPPLHAACQFIALICGDLQLRALVGIEKSISKEERIAVLTTGVEIFFRAYCLNDVESVVRSAHAILRGPVKTSSRRRKTEPTGSVLS